MKHEYLSNTPLEQAAATYLKRLEEAGLCRRTERVKTCDALGRTTSRAIYAAASAPHYAACAMDGVALKAELTFGASETSPVTLDEDAFVRVDTGDELPEGCDAVVMIEDCVELPCGKGVMLYAAATPWQHVRQIGEDISAGDMIAPSYTPITPALAGAMLAAGVLSFEALARPRFAIIPTGDEIVAPCERPAAGEIVEFNSVIFSGMLRQWGAEAVVYPIVPDDANQIAKALETAVDTCDAALLLAGTSAGRDDGTTAAIASQGEIVLHGVAIRPGKPVALGVVCAKPVIGVPGYPVSGIVVMETLVKPVVDAFLMRPKTPQEHICVKMGRRLNSSLKYREFVRATLGLGPDGMLSAIPLQRGAGVVTSFTKADCLLDVPQNCEGYEEGERAYARLLRPIEHIERTVRILGSHDPLIDEAADELKRANPGSFVSSAHVGSMGAILALSRGEAQLGGVHLLDAETGTYNVPFIERYLPEGGVALVECVMRTQGLIVAKDNPKRISCFADAAREGVRYVNRQKGAGTRVLCDHLLRQNGLDSSSLDGYLREETTHTAIAAQIAAGSADCGLGVLSAARMYDLDFIPLCAEQYDLLVAMDAMDNPRVRAFLAILETDSFRERLLRIGGYELDKPGRIRKLFLPR